MISITIMAFYFKLFKEKHTEKMISYWTYLRLSSLTSVFGFQYNTLSEATKRYEAGSQYGEFVRRLPVATAATLQYEEFKFEPYNYKWGLLWLVFCVVWIDNNFFAAILFIWVNDIQY